MLLKKLILKNYRNFQHKVIELNHEFNLINGSNDTGKSTVFSAIQELMLFDFNIYKKNFHNLSEPYFISMDIEINEEIIQISKDAASGNFMLNENKTVFEKEKAFLRYCEIAGIDINRSVFGALFFLEQRDWIYFFEKGKNIKNVADIIKNFISTGDIKSESDVLKKVRNYRKKLNEDINLIKEIINSNTEKIDEVRSFVIERETGLNVLKGLKNDLNYIQREIEKKSFIFKAVENFTELKKEFDELAGETEKLSEKLKKISKIEEKKIYLENRLDGLKNFTLEKFEEISRITATLNSKNADILTKKYDNIVSNLLVYKNLSMVFAIIILIVAAGGSFFSLIFSFLFILSGILIFLWYYFKERASEEKSKSQMDIQTQYSREIQALNNDLMRYLKVCSVSTVDEFKEKFYSREELGKNLEKLKNEYQNLIEEKSKDDIENDFKILVYRKQDLKEKLSELKNTNQEKEIEVELIKTEMEKLNEKKGKIEDEIKNLEIVLNKNRYFCDDFFELEEFINWNKRELSILEEKNDISGYVEEYIKRAHMDLMDNANSILDITMDKYFIYITAWQYQDVKVEFGEDNRLYFKVFSKKANAFLNDDILSESTLDQLYIAFRLAMIELIDEKGFFPVVLDETFSFFDTNRLESTCSLFLNIASNRQVIYFNGNQSITDFFKNKKEVSQINLND